MLTRGHKSQIAGNVAACDVRRAVRDNRGQRAPKSMAAKEVPEAQLEE